MISISIVNGEIHLQHETAEERATMHKTYEDEQGLLKRLYVAEHGGEGEANAPKDMTEVSSAQDAEHYRAGWAASAGLAAVAFDKGEIFDFFENNISGWKRPDGAHPYDGAPQFDESVTDEEKPLLQELIETVGSVVEVDGEQHQITGYARVPEGFKRQTEKLGGPQETNEIIQPGATASEVFRPEYAPTADESIGDAGHPDIRPAVNSGEPEKELLDSPTPSEGTWTLTEEELNSRLQVEREIGYQQGFSNGQTVKRETTRRTLRKMSEEWLGMEDEDLLDDDEYMVTVGKDSIDIRFVEHLVRRLGYNISN